VNEFPVEFIDLELHPSIDPDQLTTVIRTVLNDPQAEVVNVSVEALHGGLQLGSAVYCLQGTAATQGQVREWKLALKCAQAIPKNSDPGGYTYWRREAQIYQSGILDDLPHGLAAPRCYAVRQEAGDSMQLWLEWIEDESVSPWQLEQFAWAASQLGEFSGAYLNGKSNPQRDFLPHDWLERYLENAAEMIAFIKANPHHPMVAASLPGIALAMTLALWDEREYYLRILRRLPQTFCHQDAFRRNLFIQDGRLIAVDWGFAGIAPLGAELAPLIGGAFNLGGFPSSQAAELDRACFASYLEGLQSAGWRGDEKLLRLGLCTTLLLRYVLAATIGEGFALLLDPEKHDWWLENVGQSSEDAGMGDAGQVTYYQSVASEALRLLGLRRLLSFCVRTAAWWIKLSGVRR
jgi:hypothetical protein